MEERFAEEVVAPFVAGYLAGKTPNPCARCNARVKFGLLLDMARELGAERLATGHYAVAGEDARYGFALQNAADARRDQSYFLALVPRKRLEQAIFPAGKLPAKDELRRRVAGMGLAPPLSRESREICFVPGDDYKTFVRVRARELPKPGPMRLRDGRTLGRHEGLWRYTEGQRKGLGIAWSEPLYVLEKDAPGNALVLGGAAELRTEDCSAGGVNFLVPPACWPEELFVRMRYRQEAVAAEVEVDGDRLHVRFHSPQGVSAPGQLAVVYDREGRVLAGAVIERAGREIS
jgi:tRNA-specific 2-thiouridylase